MISNYVIGISDDSGPLPSVENRAVAFLDILGFRNLSTKFLDDLNQCHALDLQMRHVEKILAGDVGIGTGLHAQLFSDAIIISTEAKPDSLIRLVFTLEALQCKLISVGIFIRGGLAIGRHFQTPRTMVSEGLIAAYELESQVSRFPRILVQAKEALSWR